MKGLTWLADFFSYLAFCFEANHEIACQKRRARRAGLDPENDAEFRAVNELD